MLLAHFQTVSEPNGDRVKLTISSKVLLYRYYGTTGKSPRFGYREGVRTSTASCLSRLRERSETRSGSG